MKFLTGGSQSSQQLTASGAIDPAVQCVKLNNDSSAVAATIADFGLHQGVFYVVDNSGASTSAAHTLTLTSGTFDGTNNKATLNAPAEMLMVWVEPSGAGTILLNNGSVALSAV